MINNYKCQKCGKELCKTACYNNNTLCRKCYYKSLKGKGNPMYGFRFSKTQKDKWSRERSGINNSMFGKKGEDAPGFKHGRCCKIDFCLDCGKKLGKGISLRCKSCNKKLYYKNNDISGNKNPNWKGGRTALNLLLYASLKYRNWRNKVFKRDNYTCQVCGKRGDINAHHKIPVVCIIEIYQLKSIIDIRSCKLLWDIIWGITLCEKCHQKIR